MSYKVYQLDALTPIQWSQAAWRIEGPGVPTDDCFQKHIHAVMARHLPKDGQIVDAGCGSGKWPIHLRRLGYRMVGLDIDHEACTAARAADGGLDLAVADVRCLPVATGSVDAVISLGVVEHDERGPVEALRETRRILKRPDGVLIVSVPYDNPIRRLVVNPLQSWVTRRRRRSGWSLGFEEYRFTEREVRRFLEEAGFQVVASYPNDFDPPRTEGLWVDYQNLTFDPFVTPTAAELFLLPGWKGRVARALLRLSPWLACGEVVVVARAG